MFKFRKKDLFSLIGQVLLLLFLASLIPALRPPVINIAKYPFKFLMLIKREIGGILFYHHNLVENERLNKDMDLLRQKLNKFDEVSLENTRLNELLSFKQKSSYKTIAAKVIGHSADNWSSVIIIDKGESNGLKRGFVVINYLGLVGRISETAKYTSKIILINDPNFGVSAIAQRSRQEGLVTGTLGNRLIMKYLPLDSDIKVSDMIVTSGLTESYPKGLFIGVVIDLGHEFSGLSRYAIIKTAVNLPSLEEVLIIVP